MITRDSQENYRLEQASIAARTAESSRFVAIGSNKDLAPARKYEHSHLTRRGQLVKFGAKVAMTAGIIGLAGYGIHESRESKTITIPAENQDHNLFNVGTTVTVGTGAKAHEVKPTDLSTIAELAYPGKDYRDLASALHDEVVTYNKAHHYNGDPATLQMGTPLILPPDAQIGYHVSASAPAN
jgi:hypothetical protein